MTFSSIQDNNILYSFHSKPQGLRNNDHLAHCANENALKNVRQGGVYGKPYGDLAEGDPGFVGHEAYIGGSVKENNAIDYYSSQDTEAT